MCRTSGDVGSLVGLLDETDSEFKPNFLLEEKNVTFSFAKYSWDLKNVQLKSRSSFNCM